MSAYLILDTQVIPIKYPPLKIGRALENDLVIQDPTISRFHAEIFLKDEEYAIRDLNSTGGTFLNGQKVMESILVSGDSIVLAGRALVFVDQAPQLKDRASDSTGPLKQPGPDNEPTEHDVIPNWRVDD